MITKKGESLLLYFETCAVDKVGKVESVRMNEEDFKIVKKWHKEGFVKFGKLLFSEIQREPVRGITATHYVILSDNAWVEVARLRKERAKRHEDVNMLIESKRTL